MTSFVVDDLSLVKWSGRLFPGGRCEGWVPFEVPESLELTEATAQVTAGGAGGEWTLAR